MNNLSFHDRWCVIMAVIAVAAIGLLSGSCHRQATPPSHARNTHYATVDSLMTAVTDVDSAAMMVKRFHDNGDRVGEMLALKRYGRMLRNNSAYDKAVDAHTRMLDVAAHLADSIEMIHALNSIATDYRRKGELSQAYGSLCQALRLSDAYSDKQSDEAMKNRIRTLNGIGNIEIAMCNYSAADSVLREALAGEMKLKSNLGMAVNYSNLGLIKYKQNEIDSAWVYYRKALECNKLDDDKMGVALCHLHFGQLYEADRRFSHAKEEYRIAYDGLRQFDNWHWLEACLALANVCVKLGDEDEARDYVAQAEGEAQRINSLEHLALAYKAHCELALLEGNADKALKYHVKSDELADSINGPKTNDEIRNHHLKYETERKIGEMDALNNDITRLKHTRNMLGVLGVLLTLMAGAIIAALIYAMRMRARSQRVMRQIEETRSLFFTNVVHRLRTPLTAIMGSIDYLVNDAKHAPTSPPPGMLENVEIIERQGNNLLELVDRILEVGGVRSAIGNPEMVNLDAVPFIRMIIESYREQSVGRHIELTYASREKSVNIDTLPNYLSTIVGNLIENAITYSKDFSKITVTSREKDGKLIVRVADNGMGISQTDLPHVFEPFYRGAIAEQMVEGVGIGLTVVRDMVMSLGGTVAVDSKKDYGSVFTVTLPLRQGEGVKKRLENMVDLGLKARLKQIARRMEPAPEPVKSGKSLPVVLIVEDHSDVAQLVGNVLDEKFAVHFAADGEQGLARAMELEPDLIITDVKMPIMDGLELCRRVRASSRLCHIPVIMLSARTSKDDRIHGVEAGADAYLVKPFAQDELMAWIERLLKNRDLLSKFYSNSLSINKAEIEPSPDAKTAAGADGAFLAEFDRLVGEQMANGATRMDLDKIALAFKMGESALRRKIQALTGKNVVSYITQLRMEKAMSLLQQHPEMLIGDIAESCGFTDMAYFSRVFRQHYGMTPTQARNGGAK